MLYALCRIAGYFYFDNTTNRTKLPQLNGAIFVECKTLLHIVAEVGGIFHNAQWVSQSATS